ncbi:MAG: DUF4129 domain-containing protein [Myxococcales bacterium]|nr:DUF4129 domain-containing protein [Myxococcales bacterium]
MASATGGELQASGPLELLDRALLSVRRGPPRSLWQGLSAGLPLSLLAIAIYYFERVEGVQGLRPVFALLTVLGFGYRCLRLSRLARRHAVAARPTLPISEQPAPAVDVLLTSAVVAVGLWLWCWLLVPLALVSPWAALLGLPMLSVRGAVAPSWLARASCAGDRGLASFGQSFDDTSGSRAIFFCVELMVLLGAMLLLGNLWALLGFVVLLADSMFGLDVAFVSSFLSPDNGFVQVVVVAVAFAALEPLRAALSAQAFVEARSRRDGADLHAAVDAAVASAQPRRPLAGGLAVALLLAFGLGHQATVAQEPEYEAEAPELPDTAPSEATAADRAARQQAEAILARDEFREFASNENQSLRLWLRRLLRWLESYEPQDSERSQTRGAGMPRVSAWILMLLGLFALALILAYVSRSTGLRRRAAGEGQVSDGQSERLLEPVVILDEAAQLAARGQYREALRALYVATLVTLDRRHLIDFDPTRTNWQYLRAMPPSDTRQAFAAFTRAFDHKWYGREPATADDYQRCRVLADRICAEGTSP